jgi:hypothetical protein
MWDKTYKDYKPNEPIIKSQVEPGHGIIGCEMHDINGWGTESHIPRKRRKKGFIRILLAFLGFN